MEDMGNTPTAPRTCRHPAINGNDDTQVAREHDQYATRHNPFVYFHSIIDSPTCEQNVVPLDQLPEDVKSADTTPNFAFITPDLCNDGHDETCVDGGPGGLPAADLFLRRWVPQILASPGFAEAGLLDRHLGRGEHHAGVLDGVLRPADGPEHADARSERAGWRPDRHRC